MTSMRSSAILGGPLYSDEMGLSSAVLRAPLNMVSSSTPLPRFAGTCLVMRISDDSLQSPRRIG